MFSQLSAREQEIVLFGADGLTDKEIAVKLNVQVATVRTYWDRLRRKLGASNKGQAIAKSLHDMYLWQEKWAKLIVESAEDYAMFALSEDGIVLSWNPGVRKLLGYDEEEFIGFCADEIFTPEDREKGKHLKEREIAAKQGRALDERWHLRKNGERFWGSGMMIQLKEEGKVVGLAKIVRDRTETHQLQQQIEELSKTLTAKD